MKTPNAEKRRELAAKGFALPDGSFPIKDKQDLKDAISSFGLGKNSSAAKAHIIKRARALGALDLLPSKWQVPALRHTDNSEEMNMTTFANTDEFFAHFGVKGMKWGVRHEPTSGGGGGSPMQRRTGGAGGGGGGTPMEKRQGLSKGQKIAIGVGVGAAVALGAAAVAYNMKSGGKLSMGALKMGADLKASAFKSAKGGFDRSKAIAEVAKREARAIPSTARTVGTAAGIRGREIGRDIAGVARTSGQGVSRIANAGAEKTGFAVGRAGVNVSRAAGNARLQANLGGREARDAAGRIAGDLAGVARTSGQGVGRLSQAGAATVSRLHGEYVVGGLKSAGAFAKQSAGAVNVVARQGGSAVKTAATGTASRAVKAVGNAAATYGPEKLNNLRYAEVARSLARKH